MSWGHGVFIRSRWDLEAFEKGRSGNSKPCGVHHLAIRCSFACGERFSRCTWSKRITGYLSLDFLGVGCLPEVILRILDSRYAVLEANPGVAAAPGRDVGVKELVNLLEGLAGGLGVGEEDVEGHEEAESAEDHLRLPWMLVNAGGTKNASAR